MITVAVQKGNLVYVYGERNQLLFTRTGELHGFTSTTVSVKNGKIIHTYGSRGQLISTHSC